AASGEEGRNFDGLNLARYLRGGAPAVFCQDPNAGLVARSFEIGIQNGQACRRFGPDFGVGAVAVGTNRVDRARKQLRRIREHPDGALYCTAYATSAPVPALF